MQHASLFSTQKGTTPNMHSSLGRRIASLVLGMYAQFCMAWDCVACGVQRGPTFSLPPSEGMQFFDRYPQGLMRTPLNPILYSSEHQQCVTGVMSCTLYERKCTLEQVILYREAIQRQSTDSTHSRHAPVPTEAQERCQECPEHV